MAEGEGQGQGEGHGQNRVYQMTNEQLMQLLALAREGSAQQGAAAGAAAVVGPMPPCRLGKDKLRRFKNWSDWIKQAENKMKFILMRTDEQKMTFLRSCAGPELTEFWDKEARIKFEENEVNGVMQPAHTYKEVLEETRKTLLKLVSRDRAIIDLLRMEQGSKSFMDFLSEVEEQERLCRTDEQIITSDDIKRMSILAGLKDRSLAEKALTEEYDLKQVITAAVNRESSRANAEGLRARPSHTVNKVDEREEERYQGGTLDAKINHLTAELEQLEVRKLRQSGKYSGRYRGEASSKGSREVCPRCTFDHGEGDRCPAVGKECLVCEKTGHFARSRLCPKAKKTKKTRRVKEEQSTASESEEEPEESVNRIGNERWPGIRRGAKARGVRHITDPASDRQGEAGRGKRASRWVTVTMGGKEMQLYCDTGSRLTIIPPEAYRPSMGKVVAAKSHLRAWGSKGYLDTKGMFKTTLETASGAQKRTWVYVVAGTRPEPLLGDHDAEDLGVITFHPEGRRLEDTDLAPRSASVQAVRSRSDHCSDYTSHHFTPHQPTTQEQREQMEQLEQRVRKLEQRKAPELRQLEQRKAPELQQLEQRKAPELQQQEQRKAMEQLQLEQREAQEQEQIQKEEQEVRKLSIPARLRMSGKEVLTEKPAMPIISSQGRAEAQSIVEKHTGSVFSEKVGRMKVKPIELQYEPGFRPVQPARYPVPFHYRDKLATHLKKLEKDGVIEKVNPAEPIDCILNLAISEKKTQGTIRMNIDARPINKGAKHTRYHVTTPQEVRHRLEGAKVFSEFDMGNGFMQLPLAPSSQVVFQSHRGLHRMKRLFFGPTNSSGIFHHEVTKAFAGLRGCITIHDNLLVYGKDVWEHNRNLAAMLERARERGVTLKLSKSTVCAAEVRWFGRVYSAAGVSADPDKIQHIMQAGRPESTEDVRSLLQAAAYNARYSFDHKQNRSYEEVTAPLRKLLEKDAEFEWSGEREESYQQLLGMMSSRTFLAPYNPRRKTHLVTDASPCGIAASLYQEDEQGRWVPVDHASRAMSSYEQGWKSQIDWESLAKVWGMEMFRPYLIGVKFTSWGDHQSLIPLYNDLTRPAPVRVAKHRTRITDLTFTDKYLPGKEMPCDYASRHPAPIERLSPREKERQLVDEAGDVQVMRVIMTDLPPALSVQVVQDVAKLDPVYQKLKAAIRAGKKPTDRELVPYMSVWPELGVLEELVCRGERIVMPDGRHPTKDILLRDWVIDLAHNTHMGVDATKRLLRVRLWFPGMDRAVERAVERCLPCQASVDTHTRDPLKPSRAPEEPWSRLYADHWGPTRDGKHILVIIDGLTRYPEAIVVRGTSAEANIHAFAEVFSRHGLPKYLHSDNGAPFNGKDSHLLQQYLTNLGIEHITNRSAEDPEATGLVEAFMRHIKKIFHTAEVAREDPYLKISEYLMQFRATPHSTMKKCPAELLFNRKFNTRLPDLRTNPAKGRKDIKEAREEDRRAKEKMKEYKDQKRGVKEHKIRKGDSVLLKRKTTKHCSPYDPEPYKVTATYNTQVQAERDGRVKTRDAQRWKRVEVKKRRSYKRVGEKSRYLEDPDIGAGPGQLGVRRPAGSAQGQAPAGAAEDLGAAGAAEGLALANPEERDDIVDRLRQRPEVVLADTIANRPQRTRQAPTRYQADQQGATLRDRRGVRGGRKASAKRDH